MVKYKKILIGTNTFSLDWKLILDKINKKNIVIVDFNNFENLKNIILKKNITYILPLSQTDYNLIKTHILELDNNQIKILYPSEETYGLLDNKNLFTKFMLENYSKYIPDIYYLSNVKLKNIEYPAISKPIYSTNGSNMRIIFNDKDFLQLQNHNNIQKFIENEYEYSAHMLCIDGIIVNWKVIRFIYKKYNIKKTNFPNNYENIENFNIGVFKNIIKNLNYSGGTCIDFKFNSLNNSLYIFEINPRFGGSAFTCNFIYKLLCVV
jgi:carbamoylphosphate synthase large subunit